MISQLSSGFGWPRQSTPAGSPEAVHPSVFLPPPPRLQAPCCSTLATCQTIGSEITEAGQELIHIEATEGFHMPAPIDQWKRFGVPVLCDEIEPLRPGGVDMDHVGQSFDGRPCLRSLITLDPGGSQTAEVAAQHLGRTLQRNHRIVIVDLHTGEPMSTTPTCRAAAVPPNSQHLDQCGSKQRIPKPNLSRLGRTIITVGTHGQIEDD